MSARPGRKRFPLNFKVGRPIESVSRLNRIENYESTIEEQVLVKDIMSTPAITVSEDACIPMVARMMGEYEIESLIVTDERSTPSGMVTEKDLVVRILAKITGERLVKRVLGSPSTIDTVTAGDVMTSPLVVINPEATVVQAARKMRSHDIGRLGVVSEGKLVGTVSSSDVLAVTPDLIMILREKKRTRKSVPVELSNRLAMAGYCGQCGNWSSNLTESNGDFLCADCTV